MFETLDIFKMSSAMAKHAGHRQAIVAQNVANADTPGYRARDTIDFRTAYLPTHNPGAPRATRVGHMHGTLAGTQTPTAVKVTDQALPNGNQISLETEMLKSVGAKRQHDRALAVYKSALNILRSSMRTN